MTAFMDMGVLDELANAVSEMGWSLPTDIQQDGIPAILGGGDVLMAAETGSGKTGAFCLPIIQIVWETMRDAQLGKTNKPKESHGWRMNVFDKDGNLGIDETGFVCQSTHPKLWSGCRAAMGVCGKGKYYYEATIQTDGLCRMGWSTARACLNLGTDDQGYGFGGTGKKSYASQFQDYGESYTLKDVIGCFLNLDDGTIHYSKNGKEYPTAFKIDSKIANEAFYPAILLKNATLKLNFGSEPFKNPPLNGYRGVVEAHKDFTVTSPKNSASAQKANESRQPNAPLCLILEPTKELAEQTYNQIESFKKCLTSPKIRNVLAAGGVPPKQQMETIEKGTDIITCTPGRVRDLVHQEILDLNHVRFFVLDEADSLVSQSGDSMRIIRELHQKMQRHSADGQRLQMVVCSATLHNFDVKKLADEFMQFPQWVDLKGQDSVPDTVHHVVCMIDPAADKSWIRLRSERNSAIQTDGIHSKDQIRPGSSNHETLSEACKVLKFVYLLKAIREHKMEKGIIFCRTKLDCDHVEKFLKANGIGSVCLHSDRTPQERTENLAKFKEDEAAFLICTDVAARGLDVRGVPYVFNMTLPALDEKANYVHRIGRVGRAERMGLAISLVSTAPEKVWYHQCKSRGSNCHNTTDVNKGGCSKWFNEVEALGAIEEHLGITVPRVENDFAIPVFEYEGKVTYGGKRTDEGKTEHSHAVEIADTVRHLADLEQEVQLTYLNLLLNRSNKSIIDCMLTRHNVFSVALQDQSVGQSHNIKAKIIDFSVKQLSGSGAMSDYGIRVVFPFGLTVVRIRIAILVDFFIVETMSRKLITLKFKPSDTVAHLKATIQAKFDVPQDEQHLFFHNNLLEGGWRTLSS
ncbi:ATP-dependent RNA helicase DDX1 [Aphelenchoides besseyi]|nr:ATP-dependent RNA helicase DDX1 [Aphelenchoides besseyi]